MSLFHRLPWWHVLFGLLAVVIVLPIGSGLWLDETVTYWTIHGGFFDIIRRCTVNPQSFLYSFLIWGIDKVFGHSEAVMRLPSVLAGACAACLIYRIGRDELGRDVGLTAAALFLSNLHVMLAVIDARPYAFGILAVLASVVFLLKWLGTGRLRDGLLYSLCAALVLHLHFLFAPVFLSHVVYLFLERRRVRLRQFAAVAVCFAAVLLPIVPQFLEASRTRSTHVYAEAPGLSELISYLVPFSLALLIPLAIFTDRPFQLKRSAAAPAFFVFIASWAVAPVVSLWLISVLTPNHIYLGRFMLSAAPGSALLFAFLLRHLHEPLYRFGTGVMIASGLLLWCSPGFVLSHNALRGDWRAANRYLDAHAGRAAVLIQSPYIESDFFPSSTLATAEDDYVFFTPLLYYPCKANFIPLRRTLTPSASALLSESTADAKTQSRPFFLVLFDVERYGQPFLAQASGAVPGWHRSCRSFNTLTVYEFRPHLTAANRGAM